MATPILLVRALYDFNSTDGSSLSFRRDDVIEVLTQLESGWWDGICKSERGWFPSNYVTPLDDEEDDLLDDDDRSDFITHSDWETQTTPDGAVFYRNPRTGETSWEVPADDNESVTTTLSVTTRDAGSAHGGSAYRSANSRSGSVSSVRPVRQQQLPKNWVMQPTEDGNTYYYRNTITNEIRWTYPGGGSLPETGVSANGGASGSDIDEDENDIDAPVVPSPSRVEEEVADQDGDVEAADKESIASSRGSGLSTSTIGTQRQQHLTNGVERLPPNWGRKTTPQGRTYYYNVLTDETTWSLENVDMDTGRLIKDEHPVDETMTDVDEASDLVGGPATFSSRKLSTSSLLIMQNAEEPLTWDSLSKNVQLAIDQLNEAARYNEKLNYADGTNAIVESIRIMLYASGTVEKESPAIRQDKDLKIYHRHIMASLSKLVLSTKVASSVWPPPDATQKMESDAKEVSLAVHQFVRAAENVVDIKRVDPKILESAVGGSWRGNNLPNTMTNGHTYGKASSGPSAMSPDSDSQPSSPTGRIPGRSLTPDLLASLDHSSRNVSKAVTLLINHVRKTMDAPRGSLANNAAFAPQLISQTRQVVTQVGQFLQLVEDINLEDLEETSQDTIGEFKIAKQALYNNIAGLVICAQSATDPLAPHNAMEQVLVSSNVVDKSIKDMIVACKFLVEEKDTQDQRIIHNNMKQRASTDALVHDAQPIDEELSTEPKVPTGLTTVPEHAEIKITTKPINRDPAAADDDITPMSPISDGSSTVTASYASSRFRSDSSVSSTTYDAASIQTHPPLQRSQTQPVAPSSASADYPFPPSPPLVGTSGGAKSPREKLKRFFGDEAPPTQVARPREEKPWFLNYNYADWELVFNMEGVVKGGTLNALVERLTLHDSFDANFIATFLLTYRSFTTSEELFEKIVERFKIEPPEGLSAAENEVWVEKKQTLVRIRVFSVLKSWLENYYINEDDEHCLEKMLEFAKTAMHQVMPVQSVSLIKVIEKRQQQPKAAVFKDMIPTAQQTPPSILPKNMKKLKFLDLDSLEIARQLTIIESQLYAKIRPVECLNKAWSKETGGEIAENIKAMIYNSNQITGWVAESILNQQEIRKRCALIKHFVAIADKCRVLNNFNSLTAIISGLNSAPIHRLKRTWEMINTKTIQTLENLNKIMNSTKNFADYRDMLHSVNPPCVPFLGVYLTDLTFIEDGNPNILKKGRNLINFSKRTKTAEVIREIQQYQAVPYHLSSVQEIQIFIKSHLQDSRDVGDLYDQSLSMEPREREDEKIARLLQESGFL